LFAANTGSKSEIINISKSFNNIAMKLIVCDSEIKDVYDIRNGSIETILNLSIKGGGGTSHIPVYDYILENLPNTKFVINFTDGYTSFPDYEQVRTIWVLTKQSCSEDNIPFGEIIKLD
jgi:predicted metal-dependent peptidase